MPNKNFRQSFGGFFAVGRQPVTSCPSSPISWMTEWDTPRPPGNVSRRCWLCARRGSWPRRSTRRPTSTWRTRAWRRALSTARWRSTIWRENSAWAPTLSAPPRAVWSSASRTAWSPWKSCSISCWMRPTACSTWVMEYRIDRSIDWTDLWLIDWLFDRVMIDWLIYWFEWLIGWLIWVSEGSIEWLIDWSLISSFDWLIWQNILSRCSFFPDSFCSDFASSGRQDSHRMLILSASIARCPRNAWRWCSRPPSPTTSRPSRNASSTITFSSRPESSEALAAMWSRSWCSAKAARIRRNCWRRYCGHALKRMVARSDHFHSSHVISIFFCAFWHDGTWKWLVSLHSIFPLQFEKTLVFCETKEETDKIGLELAMNGISSTTIHGGRTQQQREEALKDFKYGLKHVLVATNVAARGTALFSKRLSVCLAVLSIDWLIEYFLIQRVDGFTVRLIGWLISFWLSEYTIDWLIDWLIDWSIDLWMGLFCRSLLLNKPGL